MIVPYCYWFRDASVYEKPKKLMREAEVALLVKLSQHIRQYDLSEFYILLHGGEPLLFGKERFVHSALPLTALQAILLHNSSVAYDERHTD